MKEYMREKNDARVDEITDGNDHSGDVMRCAMMKNALRD